MSSKFVISALKLEILEKLFFSVDPIGANIKLTSRHNFEFTVSGKTGISRRK